MTSVRVSTVNKVTLEKKCKETFSYQDVFSLASAESPGKKLGREVNSISKSKTNSVEEGGGGGQNREEGEMAEN